MINHMNFKELLISTIQYQKYHSYQQQSHKYEYE